VNTVTPIAIVLNHVTMEIKWVLHCNSLLRMRVSIPFLWR